MAQICREYGVADDLVCHWKQVFLGVFGGAVVQGGRPGTQ